VFELGVSEKHLDGAQIGAGFQHVSGETVPTGIVVILMICIPRKSAIPYIRTSELK
jgi:hypothetical protein